MYKVIVFYADYYQEYPLIDEMQIEDVTFCNQNSQITIKGSDGEKSITCNQKQTFHDITFLVYQDIRHIFKKEQDVVLVGVDGDIEIPNCKFVFEANHLILTQVDAVYINGKHQSNNILPFTYGDQIIINDYVFYVHENKIQYIDNEVILSHLPILKEEIEYGEKFPEYYRSPRVIRRLQSDKVIIKKPTPKAERKKNSLVKVIVPPVVMGAGTVAMSLMMGRGAYMLIGLAGTAVSLVFSVTAFFNDKKELKNKNIIREKVYNGYLLNIQKKIDELYKNEVSALSHNHPTMEKISLMVNEYNPRIYERSVNDDDFLTLTIGTSDDKSTYQLQIDEDELSSEKDELFEDAKSIYNQYHTIENKPYTIDLKRGHFGIVGEKYEIHEQLQWYLTQLTFFHSYHDVQIITLYNEEFKNTFDYSKWYPHCRIHANNVTGNIYNERVRDQVLGSLHQILKDRKNKRDEDKKAMSFLPHYVIIIDDYHMIMNHAIMEYLKEETSSLGFSLIYTAQKRANLPQNIKTVLVMEDKDVATLLLNEGVEVSKQLLQQRVGNIDLEKDARNLSVLQHIQGMSSKIPESITFLQMYKCDTIEELDIPTRWQNGESHKSLAVPLGLRAKDDIVELNLHEKAHGPHGLVAGTTGSGKSETIQTYILSLAVNFSPYEVGFLLIDYKGGGMANLFKKLPHLLGTITNLDGAESMRALESIKAELARRQRVFNDHEVNNINKYNVLFKSGKAKEPLPHLFIISDEFAELKKEQPEFMSELVSVARIGRTLGVHLILATQKPTGVVDDQIWSNSKFKLALKVQDESDSREIIKTSDAAFITQTGRGYLQVGNNEIYELFQTAWSGANYTTEKESKKIDDRIYKINILGQGELINKDLSENNDDGNTSISQLDAIVNYVGEYYENSDHQEVTKPWLPSLKSNIASPYIQKDIDITNRTALDLQVHLGLIDIPENQEQINYTFDFVKDGNVATFSSSGFGKSTTLGTILLSLACKNNPQLTNMYIIDLGNSSLMPYSQLPHVADYMTFDSDEKLMKFQKLITEEIKRRKQLFGQAMAQNFDMYNQMHEETPLKAMFIFIDNFDVIKEVPGNFEDFITKTTRDGFGLGIYTVISATRSNAVRFSTLNNFKNKIAQYMFDSGDVMSIVGRTKYKLNDDVKGRALVKHKNINMMQVYAPVEHMDDMEFITNLKAIIHEISNQYLGDRLHAIPVLPDVFTTNDFVNYACETTNTNLVGLSLDNVENVSLQITSSPYLVVGSAKCGKTNYLEILLSQDTGKKYVFDSEEMSLYKYKDTTNYITSSQQLEDFVEELLTSSEERKVGLEAALASNSFATPKAYYNSLDRITIYIDDVDMFIQKVQSVKNITKVLEQATSVGINIIAGVNSSKFKGFDEVTKFFKTATSGAILGQLGTLTMFNLNMRDIPTFGNAVLCNSGNYRAIKLPKFVETNGGA